MSEPCQSRRENDEYVCPRCRFRWAVDDDDPPSCLTATQINRRTGLVPLEDRPRQTGQTKSKYAREVLGTTPGQLTRLTKARAAVAPDGRVYRPTKFKEE